MKDNVELGYMKNLHTEEGLVIAYCTCKEYDEPHVIIDRAKEGFKIVGCETGKNLNSGPYAPLYMQLNAQEAFDAGYQAKENNE